MNAAAPHCPTKPPPPPGAVAAVGTFLERDVFVLIFHTARRIYSNKIEPKFNRTQSIPIPNPEVVESYIMMITHVIVIRDVWRMYLERGEFELAKEYCKV